MFDYSARPELLKDRVILVTGAGRGIGAAAAKTYAAHGATVLLLGKTEANLTQVYDEIEAAGHPQPAVIPFNLETALPHQYDELAAMIESEFGHLDGLLHNASIIGPRTPIEQLSGENFMRVMQVNVNAAAAQVVAGCLGGVHFQQRRPQGACVLGRLRRLQIRH
jgi:NAD(P)-dependent dehydrogenase (short-subunit alcohol dehydrogenase family)